MPKILVIEDNPVEIETIKARLKQKQYEVFIAKNGEDGIRLAIEENPDLIFMDMILPGMHGLEATIKLKQNPVTKEIPIVALTVMDSSEFVATCFKEGVSAFIKKPYDFEELLTHIHQYISPEEKEEKRVLVINDDPAIVTLMSSYLKGYGYLVISKPPRMFNVSDVLEVDPHVILLDIDLLEDWGIAIFKILKKTGSTRSIPIILIASQLAPEELREIAKKLGAEDFVPHLFEFAELDRKLKKASTK